MPWTARTTRWSILGVLDDQGEVPMKALGQRAKRRPGARVRAVPPRDQPRQSFTDLAYREIRRQILDSELPAGFQITEQELAERLKISRTPTREALLRLAA